MAVKQPPNAAPSRIPWDEIVEELRAHPGEHVLPDALQGVPGVKSLYATVRKGSVTALRMLGGVVYPTARGVTREAGDLYLLWDPNASQEGTYDQVYLNRDAQIRGRVTLKEKRA